jgi:hypothetical protein
VGGPWWERWNPAMKEVILDLQRHGGHLAGSWDPDPNWIGGVGGRVYATAIAVLTLEIYYRVMPRYLDQEENPVDEYNRTSHTPHLPDSRSFPSDRADA